MAFYRAIFMFGFMSASVCHANTEALNQATNNQGSDDFNSTSMMESNDIDMPIDLSSTDMQTPMHCQFIIREQHGQLHQYGYDFDATNQTPETVCASENVINFLHEIRFNGDSQGAKIIDISWDDDFVCSEDNSGGSSYCILPFTATQ